MRSSFTSLGKLKNELCEVLLNLARKCENLNDTFFNTTFSLSEVTVNLIYNIYSVREKYVCICVWLYVLPVPYNVTSQKSTILASLDREVWENKLIIFFFNLKWYLFLGSATWITWVWLELLQRRVEDTSQISWIC